MRGASGTLTGWGAGGLGVTVGGLDLGTGSGLESSASAGRTEWKHDMNSGR